MSLFGSIRLASNALRADQIALQVVGQNIANANTPGYIREEPFLAPGPTQRMGNLLLGTGVEVKAVVQKIDLFLEERLRGALSEQTSAETREAIYTQLEQLIGELTETDLSTAMTAFFSSISEILNQPESVSVRNLAVLEGKTLTEEIRRLANRVAEVRSQVNQRIVDMADAINELIEEIRTLNVRIAATEGGSVSKSDAVGLRDQRLMALENLAKLINIRVKEQPNGTVTVYHGGDYLVAEGVSRPVEVVTEGDRGLTVGFIQIDQTNGRLEPTAGELHGLLVARDEILGGFLDQLDQFAATLAFEFNKIYSSGQGLNGYRELTSQAYVTDLDQPLDNAGLAFTPVTGSFQVLVYDTQSKVTRTTDVFVDLTGANPATQTTLSSLAAQLNGIDGLSAAVTAEGLLTLQSTSPTAVFSFAEDTSGVLAALGINTFFTGSTARDLGINPAVLADPGTFAGSRAGIGSDTQNAVELAGFLDRPIQSQNGATICTLYDRIIAQTTQGSTVTRAAAEGARVFEQTLRGQKLAISGVSIDEEAVRLIAFQKAFQAGARYIGVLSELLELLVSL
ncbi:MAG: flagellar hook-associated protein FlgK [Thermoguttaceae bacterium]